MDNSEPRQSQKIAMDWLQDLPPHIKYILCEIPVGGGKSPLALNLSAFMDSSKGNAFILTPQKILQKQYEDSFKKELISSLYGKANYECSQKKTNCEIGADIKPQCTTCPHKMAVGRAGYSPNVVLNYHLALMLFKYVQDSVLTKPRKLMVFDECHTLENVLTEFNAITITETRCKQINVKFNPNLTTLVDSISWVKDTYLPKLKDKIEELSKTAAEILREYEVTEVQLTREELELLSKHKEYVQHNVMIHEQIISQSVDTVDNNYVLITDKTSIKYKELYGKRVFADILSDKADKFLFMSSTILNKDAYCSDLGLDKSKTAFISIDSEFDKENRPVLFMPSMSMNYGWDSPARKPERDHLLTTLKSLLEHHDDVSGIIHTGSFQVAKWLVTELYGKVPHDIYHHNPDAKISRDSVIDEFTKISSSVPSLLISPSITEGLDLKDDKGRFAIFVKVPFPFLGDAWIKRRMNISREWYSRQAMIAIIQGGGRIVRSKDDWGETYILDSSFDMLYKTMKGTIPKWWKEGFSIE